MSRNLDEVMPPEEAQIINWAREKGYILLGREWQSSPTILDDEIYSRRILFPFLPRGVLEYSFLGSYDSPRIKSPDELAEFLRNSKRYNWGIKCWIANNILRDTKRICEEIMENAQEKFELVMSSDGNFEFTPIKGSALQIPKHGACEEKIAQLLNTIDKFAGE